MTDELKGSVGVSGRDLDAAVAERVMGWKHGDFHTYCDPPFVSCRVCLTRFSSDIAAAMRVVDHLFRNGYTVSVHANGVDGFYWTLISTPKLESKHFESLQCDTPAISICRAALQTVGEEGK